MNEKSLDFLNYSALFILWLAAVQNYRGSHIKRKFIYDNCQGKASGRAHLVVLDVSNGKFLGYPQHPGDWCTTDDLRLNIRVTKC